MKIEPHSTRQPWSKCRRFVYAKASVVLNSVPPLANFITDNVEQTRSETLLQAQRCKQIVSKDTQQRRLTVELKKQHLQRLLGLSRCSDQR